MHIDTQVEACNSSWLGCQSILALEVLQSPSPQRPASYSHHSWHQDIGPDELSTRKISITVQLSDNSEYEGGDLKFWLGGKNLEDNSLFAQRGKGTVILFPSYLYHAVTPVTKGIRKSF